MINLYNLLNIYKELSIDIINAINNEDVDLLDELLDKRQLIINEIENIEDKSQIKNIISELNILKIDEKINNAIIELKQKIKENIKKVKEQRSVNNRYKINEPIDSVYVHIKY
ncbi:flagellar protein FliT [Thermobrachium celere]|uniref:Flagellar protein FliT n=1 Tax=Thermobrachium celere DSM 8682 TaxID=941824 RepID=R7RRZ1_9CLOT|nr:flagellar protein FliT [Thermobrachium celere]CDF58028.1 hypothetical protein TCEL_01942 [Thermobrachium celere DSM 8682]